MRRHDREITDYREILEIMEHCEACRLAFNTDPVPYILPLNFGLESHDGKITLWFHGALEGTKYDFLPGRAAFEMDTDQGYFYDEKAQDCTFLYESVIGRGLVSEVYTDSEKKHGLDLIMEHAGCGDKPWHLEVLKVTRVFRLEVETLCAKRRPLPGSCGRQSA